MAVTSYKDLIVWQKAMELTAEIYRLVAALPKTEAYALSDQMRRAAVSIPSNIAEGFGRSSTAQYIHFLSIANGSLFELKTQLELCCRIGYLLPEQIKYALDLSTEVGKILNRLKSNLEGKKSVTPDP